MSRRYARSLGTNGIAADLATDRRRNSDSSRRAEAVRRGLTDIDMLGGCEGEMLRGLRERHGQLPVVVLSRSLVFAILPAVEALEKRAEKI